MNNNLPKYENPPEPPKKGSTPHLSDLETAKIITELADHYEIFYESPTRRIETKFLFFPKTINGKTKWLIKATWEENFVEELDDELVAYDSINPFIRIWKPTKWIEK